MKCICRPTRFFTRVYPAALGLLFLLLVVDWIVDIAVHGEERSFFELMFVGAVLTWAWLMTWLHTFGFADEVWDAGDSLIVRIGETSARIPLADIESVTESRMFNNRGRVTIQLRRPGPLGRTIVFPVARSFLESLFPFFKSREAEELEERVERAQQQAGRTDPAS